MNESGVVGGIRTGSGNWSAWSKPGQCFGLNYIVAFVINHITKLLLLLLLLLLSPSSSSSSSSLS
jgi:hypothetical protein